MNAPLTPEQISLLRQTVDETDTYMVPARCAIIDALDELVRLRAELAAIKDGGLPGLLDRLADSHIGTLAFTMGSGWHARDIPDTVEARAWAARLRGEG